MTAQSLYQAGRLDAAIDALSAELRSNPTDTQRRTFLFELLCFAGNYDRAAKQLDILSQGGQQAAMGTLLYQSALHAERTRQDMFANNTLPLASEPRTPKLFWSLMESGARLGALELTRTQRPFAEMLA